MSRLPSFLERRSLLPRISATEREALSTGTVWADGELFSGRPDLRRLMAAPYPSLSERERAFLEGPVEEYLSPGARGAAPVDLDRTTVET